MVLMALTGKLVLLVILLLNLFYFLSAEFSRHRRTILMVVMIFLLIISDLLWIAVEVYPSEITYVAIRLVGVCGIGMTALFIAVSSNIRMRRVIKRDNRPAAKP